MTIESDVTSRTISFANSAWKGRKTSDTTGNYTATISSDFPGGGITLFVSGTHAEVQRKLALLNNLVCEMVETNVSIRTQDAISDVHRTIQEKRREKETEKED